MNRVLTFVFTKLLERQFRRPLGDAHIRTIVPALALSALKPDMFSFTFLFSHNLCLNQAGLSILQFLSTVRIVM